jgi:EAL domain-containing protein (putative c-di-GMP-specific phosphodiesterase class I)
MLDHTFVDELRKLLQQYQVDPKFIRLELKEDFFVNIEELEATNLVEIKKLGFSIGLDNFGTGYTAFENLSRIPADQIKIDQSYVKNLNDKTTNVVVSSLINIARAFDYQLAAEGIETKDQMKLLVEMGCEVFQGFYISEPISFEDVLNFNVEQVAEKVQ